MESIGWFIFFIILLIFTLLVLFPAMILSIKDEAEEERMRILQRNKRLKYLNKRKEKENLKYQAKNQISPANGSEVNKEVVLDSISSQTDCKDIDLVRTYLRNIERVPSLSRKEEINLGRQVKKYMQVEGVELELIELTGKQPNIEKVSKKLDLSPSQIEKIKISGQRAKEKMVAANLRLVVIVAKKYFKEGEGELLDLIQEGTIGLVKAVEKFDPSRGYKFSTYAYWWIRQGITRAIARRNRSKKPQRTEMFNKLKSAQKELSQVMSRSPKLSELAKYAELHEETINDLLRELGDIEENVLLELLVDDEDLAYEQLEMDSMSGDLHTLLNQLPDLQCRVLRMRYGMDGDEPKTLTEIGRLLGLTRKQVKYLEHDGLSCLRTISDNVSEYFPE